jgi:hypothetical protein
LGDRAIPEKVCSLGFVTASIQTETQPETPEADGCDGCMELFICSFISASKKIDLLHYCTKHSELQPKSDGWSCVWDLCGSAVSWD